MPGNEDVHKLAWPSGRRLSAQTPAVRSDGLREQLVSRSERVSSPPPPFGDALLYWVGFSRTARSEANRALAGPNLAGIPKGAKLEARKRIVPTRYPIQFDPCGLLIHAVVGSAAALL